ncbi:MAG TPA: hypothetical protein VHS26_04260, partial [Solirubrobacteraceae bacterium]|nr:hypothetical protein [Solirubrobacteraceae bacterium]
HLESCTGCNALYDEEAALGEALRAGARTEELEFPSMVKAKVWDAVRREKPSWSARLLSGWGPRVAVPVAAVLAIAAYLGTPYLRQPVQAAGIEAAYFLDEHNAEAQQNPFGPGAAPAVYTSDSQASGGAASSAASYIDTADAATLVDADGAFR